MSEREYQEWASLWEAVYGEPPSISAEAALTARVLIQCLPPIEPYRPWHWPWPPKPPRS